MLLLYIQIKDLNRELRIFLQFRYQLFTVVNTQIIFLITQHNKAYILGVHEQCIILTKYSVNFDLLGSKYNLNII